MSVLGVEIDNEKVRGVVLGGWRSVPIEMVETRWDPTRPLEAVDRLRREVSRVDRIAIGIGLAYLHVNHVKLPPTPAADQKRMLALEPDRYFGAPDAALTVALHHDSSIAFAIEADLVEGWIDAFETWAPVEAVEPAPLSLSRALAGSATEGLYAIPAGPNERGLIEIRDGRFRSTRRIPQSVEASDGQPLPTYAMVSGEWLAALGAARGIDGDPVQMLLSGAHGRQIKVRRLRRVAFHGGICVVAMAAAVWAADRSRAGTLQSIQEEITSLAVVAEPAASLFEQLNILDQELAALMELNEEQSEPLLVLTALSERLPEGAVLLSLRGGGGEWQIEGTALDAAVILPILDADERFRDVRFLAASARFQEGERSYETFSIAFGVRPDA